LRETRADHVYCTIPAGTGVLESGLLTPVIIKFIATGVVILSGAKPALEPSEGNLAADRPKSEIPFGLAQGRLRRGSRPLLRMTPMNVTLTGINKTG
jgi:hypothetical protein